MENHLTVTEVAERFGRSDGTIRRWMRDGVLEAYQQANGVWRIPVNAVENFVPPERGRPLEGRSIRFKLSRSDGRVLVAMAEQNGLTTQELAKKLVIAAVGKWILDGIKV